MPRQAPIVGKVAQILNDQEVAINRGSHHHVRLGMTFAVMSSLNPIEITDPDTGNVIGLHDREKVQVDVVQVEDEYSICRTKKYRTGGAFSAAAMIGDVFGPPVTRQETFNVKDEEFPQPIAEEDSYVKRGDKVVQLFEVD